MTDMRRLKILGLKNPNSGEIARHYRYEAMLYRICPLCKKLFQTTGVELKPRERRYFKHTRFKWGINETTYCYQYLDAE